MRFFVHACILLTCFTFIVSGQALTGRVVDKASQPIANATVTLKVKGSSGVSDALGKFTVLTSNAAVSRTGRTVPSTVSIKGPLMVFVNTIPEQLTIELFSMSGQRVSSVFSKRFDAGTFSLPIGSLLGHQSANGLYIARITKGGELYTLPVQPKMGSLGGSITSNSRKQELLAKQLATVDTLTVAKAGYISISRAVDSDLSQDLGDIILEAASDKNAAIEKKVDSLLALLSIDEKIAQTTEILVDIMSPDDQKNNGYGSVFNGGGCPFNSNDPNTWATNLDAMHTAALQSKHGIPILYGIDAVHGNGTIAGATVFPHNIGMGCTGDTALVASMANVTAKECRALGINLNFAPAISVVRDEKWGRSYEGYGETPEINSLMAEAYVRGLQGYGDLSRPDAMAACAKHFIGDGGTENGVNGGVTKLSEATMRAVHLPPYVAAVKAGVAAIMPSYNAWSRNGQTIRCTNDKTSLTDMLKVGLNWDGFCLSDWDAIPAALASSNSEFYYYDNNVGPAITAGIDMAMVAKVYDANISNTEKQKHIRDYMAALKRLSTQAEVMARIDDAVKRILRIKFRMNLFESCKSNATYRAEFGSLAHRTIARDCVNKSLVLLKNEQQALPLAKTDNVVVVGPWANKIGAQCGGWTISWQGSLDNETIKGTTILKGFQEVGGTNVSFDEQGANLTGADKIVFVVGEMPYAEGSGDQGTVNDSYKSGTVSVSLSDCPNIALLDKCFASGKPVIIILLSGRPMIIAPELAKCSAFVAAWLPGSEGAGVADVLYKVKPFTGKLTHTWPASLGQIPINSGAAYADEPKGSGGVPQFEYGFGLTYP